MTKHEAWECASKLFPTDFEQDCVATWNAGYPIYRHRSLGPNNWICDLGIRLEVNVGNMTTNLFFD